jgi:hypothetical protein
VGAVATGTRGGPGAALSREVGARAAETRGAPGAALRREVGAGAAGTRGAPRAASSQEVDVVATRTHGAPEATLHREVDAGAARTHGTPGAAPSPEVGVVATGTRGTPGAAQRREMGAEAMGTHGAPGAALHREVDATAEATRGGPRATLSREVGAGAAATCGSPGATMSQEAGTTPPPPLPRPTTCGQGKVVPVTPPDNQHRMITRGKTSFRVVPDHLVLTVVTSSPTPSPIPSSAHAALADPHWRVAMEEEYGALISNGTWEVFPRPQDSNVVTGKWVFTYKLRADGTLDRYKACWVLRGFTQRSGVDCDETFSPVVKLTTVHTVLATVVFRTWPIQQLNMKNDFLHDTLSETVFYYQPTGFADPTHPDLVCRLHEFLYGLKHAPRAWYSRFATYLTTLGFLEAKSDTSLFIFRRGSDTVYLLLYVDDIILSACSTELLSCTISALQREFTMMDLGPLHHFLGITVQRHPDGLFLHQRTYMLDILKHAVMANCKPCTTPVNL